MVSLAILGESGVLYDIDKFHYLGSPYSTYHSVFVTRKDAGFDTIEKLRAATGVKIGGQSVGFSTYNEGRLFAYMLGLKDALFIAAFGGAELDPAMMRGEIDGRATGPDTILQRNRDWLDKGLVEHSRDHGNAQRRQASPSIFRQASRDRDFRQERP